MGAAAGDRAQLWLAVDRNHSQQAMVSTLAGPAPRLPGEIDAERAIIELGVLSTGDARVWIDRCRFRWCRSRRSRMPWEIQRLTWRIRFRY